MGSTSSQIDPGASQSPQNRATTPAPSSPIAQHFPTYGLEQDDLAASSQLLEEEFVALNTPRARTTSKHWDRVGITPRAGATDIYDNKTPARPYKSFRDPSSDAASRTIKEENQDLRGNHIAPDWPLSPASTQTMRKENGRKSAEADVLPREPERASRWTTINAPLSPESSAHAPPVNSKDGHNGRKKRDLTIDLSSDPAENGLDAQQPAVYNAAVEQISVVSEQIHGHSVGQMDDAKSTTRKRKRKRKHPLASSTMAKLVGEAYRDQLESAADMTDDIPTKRQKVLSSSGDDENVQRHSIGQEHDSGFEDSHGQLPVMQGQEISTSANDISMNEEPMLPTMLLKKLKAGKLLKSAAKSAVPVPAKQPQDGTYFHDDNGDITPNYVPNSSHGKRKARKSDVQEGNQLEVDSVSHQELRELHQAETSKEIELDEDHRVVSHLNGHEHTPNVRGSTFEGPSETEQQAQLRDMEGKNGTESSKTPMSSGSKGLNHSVSTRGGKAKVSGIGSTSKPKKKNKNDNAAVRAVASPAKESHNQVLGSELGHTPKKTRKQNKKGEIGTPATPDTNTNPEDGKKGQRSVNRNSSRVRDPLGPCEAEKMLSKSHRVGIPPDFRDSGSFTPDEEEILRAAIHAYKALNNLSIPDLVQLIQFTHTITATPRQLSRAEIQRVAATRSFWSDLYGTLPRRKSTMIQRFVRRRYHNYQKGGGGWTEEEDDMLLELYRAHPNKWKQISEIMGTRADTDVRDRWKNYLQNGNTRNTQRWSEPEEEQLKQAMAMAMDRIKQDRMQAGKPVEGVDLAQYVHWSSISQAMNGTRTRLQCSVKWKQLQERHEREQANKQSSATSPAKARMIPKTPTKRSQRELANAVGASTQWRTPGKDKMLWGDKVDLITAIIDTGAKTESSIPWKQITAEPGKSHWAVADCKGAFKDLVSMIGEQEKFNDTLSGIAEYMGQLPQHLLEQKYVPRDDVWDDEEELVVPATATREKRGQGSSNYKLKKLKSNATITASDEEL